jgi:hypothetical protein
MEDRVISYTKKVENSLLRVLAYPINLESEASTSI